MVDCVHYETSAIDISAIMKRIRDFCSVKTDEEIKIDLVGKIFDKEDFSSQKKALEGLRYVCLVLAEMKETGNYPHANDRCAMYWNNALMLKVFFMNLIPDSVQEQANIYNL